MTDVENPWFNQIENAIILVGMQCESCARKFFPPRGTCPTCRSKVLKRINLPTFGQLITWTVTRVLPEGHEEETAILGVVDFGGALVLAKIRGIMESELENDFPLAVELDSAEIDPYRPSYSFHFIPSKKIKN